ncbi:hypothetical protein L7F22_066908 [Adiantum nelumboides]|nr:hypothetical protein [Adiantum nelumboides]
MAVIEGLVSLLLCSVIIVVCVVAAIVLIVVKEGSSYSSAVYTDNLWKPSCTSVHPFWLLAFRFLAFLYSSTILVTDTIVSGFGIFYFYTQWSFVLLITYFGIATVVSALAASRSRLSGTPFSKSESAVGLIKGFYNGSGDVESKNTIATLQMYWETVFAQDEELASYWGFLMQIIFQSVAGAAVLTDAVYWLGLFPFMKDLPRSYDFLEINLHGMNVVFILVDMMLNRMSFPWYRGAYFTLWTAVYVLFQWSVHALGVQWWPYPFLDPTQKYAPIWYLVLCGAHVVCYGLMWGLASLKHRFGDCFCN